MLSLIGHIKRDDRPDAELYQLCRKIQVSFKVGRINDINNIFNVFSFLLVRIESLVIFHFLVIMILKS